MLQSLNNIVMNNKKSINELIQSCLKALKETDYKREVILTHQNNFSFVKKFMEENKQHLYSESVGESLKISLLENGLLPKHKFKSISSSINLLNDVLNNVQMRRKRVSRKTYPLPGNIGEHIHLYLQTRRLNERLSDKTFYKHSLVLSRFAIRMQLDNVSIESLSSADILRFVSSSQNTTLYTCGPLRGLLRFLYEKRLTQTDLCISLNMIKKRQVEKLPSIYSIEEIRKMEVVIDRSRPIGKRNYAMFLLASRLGLRASDICFLQFGSLDWDRNIIYIQQYKSKRYIELPLLSQVGEAIIDYIRHGRPKSTHKTIFLSGIAPYEPVSADNMFQVVSDIISKAGIDTKHRHHGSHSLRHSLASQLLAQGTTLPVIADSLGHSSSVVTMTYLSVDINGLLSCSLDVPLVPEKFYTQKGGWFYE